MGRLDLSRAERGALWTVLAVAVALRIYKLNAPLWFDEIMTLIHYVRLPWRQLVADFSSFNNHILYSLQAKLAVNLLGDDPWVLRLPAVIFGVASIWALWRLARTVLGPTESLVAAALMSISYHHIWFSQNARGYTELMFWCLAALIIFVEATGSRSWRAWLGFAAVLAAAMYTHLTAAFFVAALGLVYVLMLLVRQLRLPAPEALKAPAHRVARFAPLGGFIAGGVLTLALCAPALPQMISQVGAVEQTSQVDLMREYQNPIWTVLEGIRTMGGSGGLMLVAVPAAALAGGIGVIGLLRKAPVIALTGALHIGLTLAGLLAMNMRIWPRFFFTDIAFALLFITHGAFLCAALAGRIASAVKLPALTPARIFGAAAVVMVAASAVLALRNYSAPKQDFPGAVAVIGRDHGNVGAVGLAAMVYEPYLKTGWPKVETAQDLRSLALPGARTWAVVIFPSRTERENAGLMKVLQSEYELVRELPGTLGDGEVLVYASRPAAR